MRPASILKSDDVALMRGHKVEAFLVGEAFMRASEPGEALATIVIFALIVSSIAPYDRITWLMEVLPVLIAMPILFATRHSFRLTSLLYILIALHALVLIGGGAYTYARVPLGYWLQDLLGSTRNPYDKIGHFMQGFVPAMVAREILIRCDYVRGRKMLDFSEPGAADCFSARTRSRDFCHAGRTGGSHSYGRNQRISDLIFVFCYGRP